MKKLIRYILILLLMPILISCLQSKLPLPENEEGLRGDLGIDKNINETTIDNYLNRNDSVYIDLRMLIDEANYEAIGGNSYLNGFIEGFTVLSYPYICNVKDLPAEVGNTYIGKTLFTLNDNNEYINNYEESLEILEFYFPKNKNIFLMCGGGGYAGMMKNLLIALGWDSNRIYNIGGYWYYNGDYSIKTEYEENGSIKYNFDIVNYQEIDFNSLTPIDGYDGNDVDTNIDDQPTTNSFLELNSLDELNNIKNNKETFLLYIYIPGCTSCSEFKKILSEFQNGNEILPIYQINYSKLDENNEIKNNIKTAPSLFIYVDGLLKDYLNPSKDDDKNKYKDIENLSKWIDEYIDINIIYNTSECSGSTCELD